LQTIGFVGASTSAVMSQWTAAFVQRLRGLGWIEGRTITIEYRWGEGRSERFTEIAAEFVRLKVGIIVASGNAALGAQRETWLIPLFSRVRIDPLGSGLFAGRAGRVGNAPGLSLQQPDSAGKRLELLREIVPGLRGLAIMANANYPSSMLEMHEVQA